MAIIRQVLQDATAATAEQATASAAGGHTAGTVSSSNGSTGNGSGGGRILLRAVVEVASMLPTNGRLATLNQVGGAAGFRQSWGWLAGDTGGWGGRFRTGAQCHSHSVCVSVPAPSKPHE